MLDIKFMVSAANASVPGYSGWDTCIPEGLILANLKPRHSHNVALYLKAQSALIKEERKVASKNGLCNREYTLQGGKVSIGVRSML